MACNIEFVDGNTGRVVHRAPADQVPEPQRAVTVDGTRVPIVRVVRTLIDASGRPADEASATRAIVQEFDAAGIMRRETILLRS